MAILNRSVIRSALFLVICIAGSSPASADNDRSANGQYLTGELQNRLKTIRTYQTRRLEEEVLPALIQGNCEEHTFAEYQRSKNTMSVDERAEELKKIEWCDDLRAEEARLEAPINVYGFSAYNSSPLPPDPRQDQVVEDERKRVNASIDFLGLSWGLGFGFSWSEDDAVDEATIVNGIVRASSNKKEQPRLVLEFHRFMPWFCNADRTDEDFGCGPFVAVASRSEDLLGGVGMGWMWGFKSKPSDSAGFSIGVGAILDGDVKDLADGFEDGKPAPNGENDVRFVEESRWSALVFVTRTF
tara:strand:+ start:6754 stop:7653 length:900 start_codon:yes stop_codon:yes gene_type:complete